MGDITDRWNSAWRDFTTDGVPATGANEPAKGEIRPIGKLIENAINTAMAGITTVANIAARDAFFAIPANQGKLVYVNNNNGSATDPLNGVYEYVAGTARIALGFYNGLAAVVQPLVDEAEAARDVAVAAAASLLTPAVIGRPSTVATGTTISTAQTYVFATPVSKRTLFSQVQGHFNATGMLMVAAVSLVGGIFVPRRGSQRTATIAATGDQTYALSAPLDLQPGEYLQFVNRPGGMIRQISAAGDSGGYYVSNDRLVTNASLVSNIQLQIRFIGQTIGDMLVTAYGAPDTTDTVNTASYIGASLSAPNELVVGQFGAAAAAVVGTTSAYTNYVAQSGKPTGVEIELSASGSAGKLLQIATSGVVLASVTVDYYVGGNYFGATTLASMVDHPSWYMFFEPSAGGGLQRFIQPTGNTLSFTLSQSHNVGDTVTFNAPSTTATLSMRVYSTTATILSRLSGHDASIAGTNTALGTLTAQVAALAGDGQFRDTVFADINGIQGSGQSLMVGVNATPGLTTVQPFANVMLANGEHDFTSGDGQGITGPPTSTALAPLVYTAVGETVGLGGTNMVKSQLNAAGGPAVNFSWSNNGRGATAIAGLSKGTNYYNWGLQQQALLKSLANAQGKSYVQRSIWWMQGEADASAANDKATYKSALKQLLADWNADLPQSHVVPLLSYQMASHAVRGTGTTWVPPNIAQAQLEASLEDDNIFLVCPMYFVTYNADNVHLTNHSERWIGQYFAKVDHIVSSLGLDWQPLYPVACRRQGVIIDLEFHVPVGQLVFDTSLVSAATNMGFTAVKNSDASAVTISSVALRGKTGVRIVLAADPGEEVRVRYAWGASGQGSGPTTGARGNLRDQDATVSYYTNASGQPYPLQNWCVIFEMVSGGY
ncbi:carbohydrate esterase-like sialic acid-specific acetylesterase [Novosphingobium sp. PhB165]|uniref:sialate O-acetylesterase n=1 Tax=Novosphingobium sp. PhB165 TaxID=2485105 RepID=UPI001047E0AB|nr:sialate O-acetylesterase [Novosphingobium sp. PhB165]TCM21469.1 carbohydrate esterase-like sialic acid-specific acetylesterase [Novosphingobium sp. PhB165]